VIRDHGCQFNQKMEDCRIGAPAVFAALKRTCGKKDSWKLSPLPVSLSLARALFAGHLTLTEQSL
jgi:hypothetical protein